MLTKECGTSKVLGRDSQERARVSWNEPFLTAFNYDPLAIAEHAGFPRKNVWFLLSGKIMDWTQLHLALNHIPVIGFPVLLLLLAVGWFRKSEEMQRVLLWSIACLSVAAIAIKFTGDFAAEQSPEKFAEVKTIVSQHEQAADQATTAVFLLGLGAGLGLFLARRRKEILPWTLALVLFFGIVTILLYARTAHNGGQISHPELRG